MIRHNKIRVTNRVSWDKMFIDICLTVAKRSHDAQTQFGAVLVNSSNEIIATGYNGFVRDIDDSVLPNLRPDKYPFMLHAEHNALLSCARQGKSTLNTKMYITGPPCLNCFQFMYQAGVTEILYTTNNQAFMCTSDSEYKNNFNLLVELTGMSIIELDNLNF